MSIGLELLLQPMLRRFTKVAVRRLNLTEVRLYFLHDRQGQLALPSDIRSSILKPFFSSTLSENVPPPAHLNSTFERLTGFPTNYQMHSEPHSEEEPNEFVYYYNLTDIGMISLHSHQKPINAELLELLKPIVERLAVSCQASIEHHHLLQAIEDRKRAEEVVRFQLLHDELTQLPNRRSFMRHLDELNNTYGERNLKAAVLFVDFDRFKTVNDTLGHSVGDYLLQAIAKTFVGLVRTHEIVARLSGDEFVIVLSETEQEQESVYQIVETTLSNIQLAFSSPLQAGEHLLHITPSIGVEFFPNKNTPSEQILRHADTAMYVAKSQAPNSAVIYDPSMSIELEQRQHIEKKLQLAIKEPEQFHLLYQPQFNAQGDCVGAEALVRWQGQNLSPEDFIPVAEDTGLMLELGHQILTKACDDLKRLQDLSLDGQVKRIAINVSALQFNQRNFTRELASIISNAEVNSHLIGIEITESALVKNTNEAIQKIAELSEMGITVSIDDFGTGYSSLAYLNRLPVNALKIDQTFVKGIANDANNLAIVETIMALGNSLNISVMAEGVENPLDLECLKRLGCELYQGFYFGKPMPIEMVQHSLLPAAPSLGTRPRKRAAKPN